MPVLSPAMTTLSLVGCVTGGGATWAGGSTDDGVVGTGLVGAGVVDTGTGSTGADGVAGPPLRAVAPYIPGSLPSGAETRSRATVGLDPSFEYARM